MNRAVEHDQRVSDHGFSNLRRRSGEKPMRTRFDASWRGRAWVLGMAAVLGWCGAVPAEGLKIGGSGAALGTMRLLANEFRVGNPDIVFTTLPSLGSGGGIKAVLDEAIGLAVTSRPLDEAERKRGAVETEYARTPFVFAVSAQSSVTAITLTELADIYAGKMVAWADGSPVRIVLRPVSEIDTEIVKNMSADMRRALPAAYARAGVRLSVNDQDAANDLERIAGAIGPSTLALIVSEKRALRALTLDGMAPTPMNAAAGAYPYYKRLFFVTGARRPPAVERFMAFVQSPAGRKILVANRHWIP